MVWKLSACCVGVAERDMATLSRRLIELREQRGLSQEAVAHAAGIAVTTYARIERGGRSARNPTFRTLAKVCGALGVDEVGQMLCATEPFAVVAGREEPVGNS